MKPKSKQNIDITISIGDYNLQMSVPRETKVSSLLTIVKNYEQIHSVYAPMDSYFIGLASKDNNPVIDYWLTQRDLDFCRFLKKRLQLKALYTIDKWIDKLTIADFQFLKCLGKGVVGEVYLVRNKVTGYLFALKRLKKMGIKQFTSLESIVRQKNILSILPQNPHTVAFHGSFQSANYFNFLLDYYPGGQLFIHLTEQKVQLEEKQIKIYFCEIVLAMEYLHKNKILYRDLKPQNILVDINGHLRITDFGLSKCGFEQENVAHTFCGSQQYMAPEVIQNQDYNYSADFYSIGAILYEILTGLPPYYQESDHEAKLQQMINMDLDFSLNASPHLKSPHLRALLRNLLHPNPNERLSNYHEIKNSPWLADIDWKQVQAKKSTLPFAPNVYQTYIADEFLQLQEEVERMNMEESEYFDPLFQKVINFIRPTSMPLIMGTRPSNLSQKGILKEITDKNNSYKNHISEKRKTTGFIKEKQKITTKHKQNYSIQLFEKDDSASSSHTSSIASSNATHLPYDPKTTRNAELRNKENMSNFKKSTKKLMAINDTIAKISKQPSQKRLLTKQPSQNNLLKQKTQKPPLSQKIILKHQPTTPIRLNTNPPSHQQREPIHLVTTRHELQRQRQTNQFTSRSKLQPLSSHITRDASSKRLVTRNSQNFSSIKDKPVNKSNMKSKTKQKSKSKDKLQIKTRTKENFPLNGPSNTKNLSTKVKLPSCTYKIKLI